MTSSLAEEKKPDTIWQRHSSAVSKQFTMFRLYILLEYLKLSWINHKTSVECNRTHLSVQNIGYHLRGTHRGSIWAEYRIEGRESWIQNMAYYPTGTPQAELKVWDGRHGWGGGAWTLFFVAQIRSLHWNLHNQQLCPCHWTLFNIFQWLVVQIFNAHVHTSLTIAVRNQYKCL